MFGKAISYINNEKSEQVLQSKERVIRKREKVGKKGRKRDGEKERGSK